MQWHKPKNMKFINPLNGREETELTHEIFEELYLNSRPNVDINTLFKHDCNFRMPDRLSRVHFKRTIKQKQNKCPLFVIHSSTLQRTLFNEECNGRYLLNFPFTIPQCSIFIAVKRCFDIWYYKTFSK